MAAQLSLVGAEPAIASGARPAAPPRRGRSAACLAASALALASVLGTAHLLARPSEPAPAIPIAPLPPAEPAPAATAEAELRSEVARLAAEVARLTGEQAAMREALARAAAEQEALRRALAEARAAPPPPPAPEGASSPEAAAPPVSPAPAAPSPALAASTPLAVPAPPARPADPLQAGVLAYRAGKLARAYALWRPLAEQGVARAQFHLAALYLEGRIVPADRVAAYGWAKRARDGGHAAAEALLARIEREATPTEREAMRTAPPPR